MYFIFHTSNVAIREVKESPYNHVVLIDVLKVTSNVL
jgi:hypothetical protein